MKIERLHDTGWANFEIMDQGRPSGATVHRTRPSEHGFADTAAGVRDIFRDHVDCSKVAKASIPFHVVIEPTGHVVQTAPLNRKLWHAYKLNSTHLGICCVGDFRETAMPAAQRAALVGVCVGLVKNSGGQISADEILGHTERPEGSRNPNWDSPGKTFSMDALRNDVKERTAEPGRTPSQRILGMWSGEADESIDLAFSGETFVNE